MARKLVPSIVPIPDEGKTIVLSDNVIGITVRNNLASNGNLLVGVNGDDAVEVLLPGQELSIGGYSAGEPYFLTGSTIKVEWDSGVTTKNATYTLLKDGGPISKC